MTIRILIAEDDPMTHQMIKNTLTKQGVLIDSAENGDDAITLGVRQQYDLVITDIQMPGTEGIEVIPEILEKWPKTKIIAISSLGRTGFSSFLEIAEAVGAQTSLGKPFTPDELLEKIHSLGVEIPRSK